MGTHKRTLAARKDTYVTIQDERRQALIATCSRDFETNRFGMALMRDTQLTLEEERVANDAFLDLGL